MSGTSVFAEEITGASSAFDSRALTPKGRTVCGRLAIRYGHSVSDTTGGEPEHRLSIVCSVVPSRLSGSVRALKIRSVRALKIPNRTASSSEGGIFPLVPPRQKRVGNWMPAVLRALLLENRFLAAYWLSRFVFVYFVRVPVVCCVSRVYMFPGNISSAHARRLSRPRFAVSFVEAVPFFLFSGLKEDGEC